MEDTAFVTLDYGTDWPSVRLSWAAQQRRIRFRFVGDRGELCGDDHGLRLFAETTEEVRFDAGMSRDSKHADWYAPLFTGFVERVRAGDASTEGLDEAVSVARIISRAYESAEQGRSLSLWEAAPRTSSADGYPTPVERLEASSARGFGAESVGRGRDGLEPREPLPAPSAALEDTSVSLPAGLAPFEPVSSPAPRRSRLALRVAGLAALGAAVAWTFHDVNWKLLGGAMANAQPGWLALAACVNLAVLVFHAARWGALVRPLSTTATFRRTLEAMTVGFTVSTVVPARMGELARLEWFGRTTGVSRISTGATILLDHLVNAVGLLAGLAVLPFLLDVPLWLRPGGYFALAFFAVGVAVLLASLRRPGTSQRRLDAAPLPVRALTNFLAKCGKAWRPRAPPRPAHLACRVARRLGVRDQRDRPLHEAVGLEPAVVASILVLVAVNIALAVPFAPPANAGTLELGATLASRGVRGAQGAGALAFALCYHFLQVMPIGIIGFWTIVARGPPGPRRRWPGAASLVVPGRAPRRARDAFASMADLCRSAAAKRDADAGRQGRPSLLGARGLPAPLVHVGDRPIVRLSLALGLTPDFYNYVGLALGVVAGRAHRAGLAGPGGWATALCGVCDILDGRIARALGVASAYGDFIDSTFDRFVEAFVFLGFALYLRATAFGPFLAAAALAGSLVVSYARARGEVLGVLCTAGLMQRGERLVVVSLACLLDGPVSAAMNRSEGWLVCGMLGFIAMTSAFTAVHRTYWIAARLR